MMTFCTQKTEMVGLNEGEQSSLSPLLVLPDLPSGLISARYPTRPMSIVDSDFSIQLYCLSVGWRCDGVKRPTHHRHFYLHILSNLGWLNVISLFPVIIMPLILPSGVKQWPLNRPPPFCLVRKVENHITSSPLNLLFCGLNRSDPGDQEETRRRWVHWKSLGSFFSVNLVSGCWWWSIFGGERGPLLYFGFLVARLLSPRSPITQFELTLPVQGEPWPGATHCYNSSNTMKSNITLSTRTVTHTHIHILTYTHDLTLFIQCLFKRLCWEDQ